MQMLPYRYRAEAKHKRMMQDLQGQSFWRTYVMVVESTPPLPYEAMEEEVFDCTVCDLFPCGPKGSDDSLRRITFFPLHKH